MPNKCILYADDTTILSSDNDIKVVENINSENLDKSQRWLEVNKLTVNKDKTEYITFGLSDREIKSVKLLGIFLDTKLDWAIHCEHLCTKLSRIIYLLRKLKQNTQTNFILQAYYAYFHSYLTYGVLLWGNSKSSKQVFIWQKKAVRCITGISLRESCREHFKKLKIITLPSVYILQSLLYIKENILDFNLRSDVHIYNTRQKSLLNEDFTRLTKVQNSFKYIGMKLFNKLPPNTDISLHRFKSVVQEWLTNHAFYSIEEFESCKDDIVF